MFGVATKDSGALKTREKRRERKDGTTAGRLNCHEKSTVPETDNYFKIAAYSDFSRSSV